MKREKELPVPSLHPPPRLFWLASGQPLKPAGGISPSGSSEVVPRWSPVSWEGEQKEHGLATH